MRLFRRLTGIFFIALALMGIGWFIWNIGFTYLGLVSKANPEIIEPEVQQVTTETVFALPEVSFWTCQVGVFSKEANALTEENRLKALGFPASRFSRSPCSVGVGYAFDPEELKGLQKELLNKGINAYIKKVTINEQRYKIGGQGSLETILALQGVNAILRMDNTSESWGQTISLVNDTFKEGVPRELYTIRDEFSTFSKADVKIISFKRLSLSMTYQQTLMNLTNKLYDVL